MQDRLGQQQAAARRHGAGDVGQGPPERLVVGHVEQDVQARDEVVLLPAQAAGLGHVGDPERCPIPAYRSASRSTASGTRSTPSTTEPRPRQNSTQ